MCELFFSYWNPHQAEQVNCCPQQVDPRLAGTRRLTLWPPHCLNTSHGSINTKDSTYPLQAGTHGRGGTRPMWPIFPSKAVKLSFYFTQTSFVQTSLCLGVQRLNLGNKFGVPCGVGLGVTPWVSSGSITLSRFFLHAASFQKVGTLGRFLQRPDP